MSNQTKKGLIMFGMSHRFDWQNGLVNRNYHILEALKAFGEYDAILHIDFLPFTRKKRLKVVLKSRPWLRNTHTVYSSLTTRVDTDEQSEQVFYMSSTNTDRLMDVLKKIHFPMDDLTVWGYNPLAAALFDQFPNAFTIFDAVDNWIDHPSYEDYTEELKAQYEYIRKHVDLIFTVSEELVNFFERKHNVYYVPNGVDANHFDNAPCVMRLGARTFENNQPDRVIVGYHGVIQKRVNLSIIDYLSEKHPEMDFVLIGPVWKEMQEKVDKLLKRENVFAIGPVSYRQLPQMISCFDIACIPHRVDRFSQSMNPLKLYEYLAAGKPIVTTAIAGVDQFHDYLYLAVSPEDFSVQIQRALKEDSLEAQNARKNIVQQHTWQHRIHTMLDIIERVQNNVESDT